MDTTCIIIRFIVGCIGMYEVLSFAWSKAEMWQFGTDVYEFSIADTVVCLIIAVALNCLLVYGEQEW